MSARAYSTSAWSLRVHRRMPTGGLSPAIITFRLYQLTYQHVTFENSMVEHQIHKPVSVADEDALLASLEAKTVAQFQQELLQPIEYSILKIRLAHDFPRSQTEKLEDVAITNCKAGLESLGTSLDQIGRAHV